MYFGMFLEINLYVFSKYTNICQISPTYFVIFINPQICIILFNFFLF